MDPVAQSIADALEYFQLPNREAAATLPAEKKEEIYNFLMGRYLFYQLNST